MRLCQFQDSLGVPGEGIHSYRIFNVPVADYIMTFILTAWIASFESVKKHVPNLLTRILFVFSAVMILGAFLHTLFCVKSNLVF